MFEARFRLRHRGCWTRRLARFKSSFTTHFTARASGGLVQDVMEVSLASPAEGKAILSCLKRAPVSRVEVLERSERAMLLQVFTDSAKVCSVVDAVMGCGCFPSGKVRIEGGMEEWAIAAPGKPALSRALDAAGRLGEFRLVSVKKSSPGGFGLSRGQEDAIRRALDSGHYAWPRESSLSALARGAGVSGAAFSQRLRAAERKVLGRALGARKP
jgi:predicted DNA binding protein